MPDSQDLTIRCDRLFDGEILHERPHDILIADGRIVDIVPASRENSAQRLVAGALVAPGFVDLQVNGGAGVLLNDDPTPRGIARIAAAHRRHGTTAFLPTLITDTRATIAKAIEAVREARRKPMPGILGIHLEGPFINPARKGVHRPELMDPPTMADVALLASLGTDGVTLVTLAPERVPQGFVAALRKRGVIISAGHSDANEAEMRRAMAEGMTGVTHLYNAMSPILARAPGVVGVTLAEPTLIAGIIADGLHVSPTALKVAFRAKGPECLALVTDAMPCLGADDPNFSLFGVPIRIVEGRPTAPDGTLAGANLGMNQAVRNAITLMGASLAEALRMASLTPARFLGLHHELGRIAPGFRADLVALDESGDVIDTWIGGKASGQA